MKIRMDFLSQQAIDHAMQFIFADGWILLGREIDPPVLYLIAPDSIALPLEKGDRNWDEFQSAIANRYGAVNYSLLIEAQTATSTFHVC